MKAADRAVRTLGMTSLISALFTFISGDPWGLVRMPALAALIALALGLAACAAAASRQQTLQVTVGGGFLLAAATVLLELALDREWIGGSGSTLALWLGLGAGIAAAGAAPRDQDPSTTR